MHDPQKIRVGKSVYFVIAALTFWGFFITIIVANRVSKIKKIFETVIAAVVALAVGGGAGYVLRKNVAEGKLATAEEKANRMIKEAEETIEAKKKESLMEAKDEIHRLRSDMERENKERRNDLQRQERRLVQKEENLDRKIEASV